MSITTSYIIIVSLLILLLCFEIIRSIRKSHVRRERKREQKWMPLYEKLEEPYQWQKLSENISHTVIIRGRKARVRWDASASEGVTGYRLYWAVGGGVNYDSEFAEVGNVTEAILPDDVPSFPVFPGNVEFGVTAVTEHGEESDMTKSTAIFGSKLQEAPRNSERDD